MFCGDKIMSRPIIPNVSHLHKVSHNIPTQSHIPKKYGSAKIGEGDASLNNSVVNSFLHSVNSRENSAKNNNQTFRSQHTLKLSSSTNNEQNANHFGLRRVNGSESAVQNRVKTLNRNSVEEPESVVTYRNKSTTDRRVFGTPKVETSDRDSLVDDKKWKVKFEEAEKKRKELLSESQKCKCLTQVIIVNLKQCIK